MNKFYTPHLDEFRDGVVFYLGGVEKEYLFNNEFIEENLDKNCIQIKFLDVEDILSLGFNLFGETYDTKVFHKILESTKSTSIIELVLMKIGDTPIISLQVDDEQYLASCICKNKFELEFILNRLKL